MKMPLRIPPPRRLRLINTNFLQCRSFTRTLTSKTPSTPAPLDRITLHRLQAQRQAHYKRRSYYAASGLIVGMVAIWVTATSIELDKPTKLDSGNTRINDPMVVLGKERKIVVQKLGEEPEEIPDVVETGTSTVPTFPRVLEFLDEEGADEMGTGDGTAEYQLLGVGIRTVSFIGIQVYVVGMYIATDDIASLQAHLIKKISSGATTLVADEKDKLKEMLYDPEEGEKIWGDVLRETGARTLLRIVPTRNTDFHHLRDAWVRQITAKAQSPAHKVEYGEESFGVSLGEFKNLLNRGTVPKQKELLLARNRIGKLSMWYDDGKNGAQRLGEVRDERISRALWLHYLAGKNVASEGARKSIVEGVMEFVERPVGTVATQVHV